MLEECDSGLPEASSHLREEVHLQENRKLKIQGARREQESLPRTFSCVGHQPLHPHAFLLTSVNEHMMETISAGFSSLAIKSSD